MSIAPAVREALGLDESATEDAVNAAILEKLTAPVAVPTPIVQEPVAVTPPAPIVDTTPVIPVIPAVQDSRSDSDSGRSNSSNLEQQVAAAVSAALPAAVQAQVSAQVAPLAASNETLRTELTRVSAELADTKQAKALQVRDDVIGGAISAGKIRSSDRERFTALYEASPQVVVDLFSHLSVGSAVPISAAGYAGDDTQATDEFKSFEASFGWEAASNG